MKPELNEHETVLLSIRRLKAKGCTLIEIAERFGMSVIEVKELLKKQHSLKQSTEVTKRMPGAYYWGQSFEDKGSHYILQLRIIEVAHSIMAERFFRLNNDHPFEESDFEFISTKPCSPEISDMVELTKIKLKNK